MIYDGPRDSFVQNAKIALKLADTDIHLWADLNSKPPSVVLGGPVKLQAVRTPSRPRDILSSVARPTGPRYGAVHTFTSASYFVLSGPD